MLRLARDVHCCCGMAYSARLTIQPWLSGILTMGETPHDAIEGTALCIAASSKRMLGLIGILEQQRFGG